MVAPDAPRAANQYVRESNNYGDGGAIGSGGPEAGLSMRTISLPAANEFWSLHNFKVKTK